MKAQSSWKSVSLEWPIYEPVCILGGGIKIDMRKGTENKV